MHSIVGVALAAMAWAPAPDDVPPDARTEIEIAPDCTIALSGAFRRVDRLWEDAALLCRRSKSWSLLASGDAPGDRRELEPTSGGFRRHVFGWQVPPQPWIARWSSERLELLDAGSLSARLLDRVPTLTVIIGFGELFDHPDPEPVPHVQPRCVIDQARRRVLFATQEWSNEQVAFWQRSERRTGGHRVGAFDLADGTSTLLIDEPRDPGILIDWDAAPGRGEVYLLFDTDPGGAWNGPWSTRALIARNLEDGTRRTLPAGPGVARWITVSPDEDRLVVEQSFPQDAPPLRADADGAGPPQARPPFGGFLVVDLESGDVVARTDAGNRCAWRPGHGTVTHLDTWSVREFDPADGSSHLLAEQLDAPEIIEPHFPHARMNPAWSADGERLAFQIAKVWVHGEYPRPVVLVDFARQEYLVLDTYASEVIWIPLG